MDLNIGNTGVWGFRHYKFLKQNRPSTVGVMRMNGKKPGFAAAAYRFGLSGSVSFSASRFSSCDCFASIALTLS